MQRREENLRVAVRADVHKMAPEYPLDPMQLQGAHLSRLRGAVVGGFGQTPANIQRVGIVLQVLVTLCTKMPLARRGNQCPFSTGCGFAA